LADGAAFGTLLKRYRLAAGLTLETLAERAALSARAISDLERRVSRAPRSETLALLLEALGLSSEERATLTAAARRQPPTLDMAGPRHNLPIQLTSFVGRESELHIANGLLRRPDVRLLTVTGTGGTGKTRFAIQLAMGVLDEFHAGARFVTLAPVGAVELIGPAIARTLGAADADRRTAPTDLVELLKDQDQDLLLLLDNFEHLLPAASILVDLLRACPRLKLLVTSRAALRVSAEQVFPLSPLPLPDLAHLPPLEELAGNPAVALFEDRAAYARPDFALTQENADAVAAICTRLDGLPLAVELAAARIRLLPLRTMLALLEDGTRGASLRLLSRGARDLPRRQQTLRDAIAWSYALLAPREQRLFRAFGAFTGGCTLEAVQAVCRPTSDEWLGIDAIDGLAELVDNSLLQQADGPDGEPRFVMLDTIRAFAQEQLTALGEEVQLRRQHAQYYLALLEATGALLFAGAPKRQHYTAEQDNVQAALRWLVKQG
jgi:predicted ATPase/transcriptional regulator with XRE-family HTH domain